MIYETRFLNFWNTLVNVLKKSSPDFAGRPIIYSVIYNKDLYDIYSEIIYADIQMLECYHFNDKSSQLNIPLIAFMGTDDKETPKIDMQEWKNYTTNNFNLFLINGDHFFPFENSTDFLAALCTALKSTSVYA